MFLYGEKYHLWKFQPKSDCILAENMNEIINKENKKNSGFGEACLQHNAITPLS